MRTLTTMVVLFAAATSAHAQTTAWQQLEGRDRYATFLSLAEHAGLRPVLEGRRVTVFAPDDHALATLGCEELERLRKPEHRVELRNLIAGHVVWGVTVPADVRGVTLRGTLAHASVRLTPADATAAACAHFPSCVLAGVTCGTQTPLFHVEGLDVWPLDDASAPAADVSPVYRIDGLLRRAGGSRPDLRHAPGCHTREVPSPQAGSEGNAGGRARRPSGGRDAAGGRNEPSPNEPVPDEPDLAPGDVGAGYTPSDEEQTQPGRTPAGTASHGITGMPAVGGCGCGV